MITFKQFLDENKTEVVTVQPFNKNMIWEPPETNNSAAFMITQALTEKDSKKLVTVSNKTVLAAASYFIDNKKQMNIEWFGSMQSGAGSMLMQKLIDISIKMNLKSIVVSSTLEGDKFYKKFGFNNEGRLEL